MYVEGGYVEGRTLGRGYVGGGFVGCLNDEGVRWGGGGGVRWRGGGDKLGRGGGGVWDLDLGRPLKNRSNLA